MHDKAKNIQIGIFASLFVIATVASIVIFIKYKETNEVLVITEQELQSNTKVLAANTNGIAKVENTTTEKVVEKNIEIAKIINFDRSKTKKVREGVTYGDIYFAEKIGNCSPKITSNGELYFDIIANTSEYQSTTKKVEGLDKKAIDILSGSIGNGGSERVVILLEDGSVAYINDPFFTEQGDTIKTNGKIEGVNNIVRILCCRTTAKEGSQVNNTGLTFIAIDKDGAFYDIGMLDQ